MRKRGSSPDRAHVVLELKKGAAPTLVGPENLFSAGKDATGAGKQTEVIELRAVAGGHDLGGFGD